METIESKITKILVSKGLFPEQAAQVMELVKAAPENESMQGRWSDAPEGYPDFMMGALVVSVNSYALEWIDANKPRAWFRPMFAQ